MEVFRRILVELRKLKWKKAASKSLEEFMQHTALHAYQYLIKGDRPTMERYMWFIFHIFVLAAAVFTMMFAWNDFTSQPTFTTLESQIYPVTLLDFPGVSICNINKISKKGATEYAKFLLSKVTDNSTEQTLDKMFHHIRYLGRLFDHDIEGSEEFLWFQNFLDEHDMDETLTFPTRKRMEQLMPKCEEYIPACFWLGRRRRCSELMEFRRTNQGYCCTFNFVRSTNFSAPGKALKSVGAGLKNGLTLVLNASDVDYYYPTMNTVGATIQVFSPGDFPDLLTGRVVMDVINRGDEKFMALKMTTIETEEEVRRYKISQRMCMFPDDLYAEFGGRYSFVDCLVKCRIRSVSALCGCIPFQLPTNFVGADLDETPKCTLQHIPCLNKYRTKWRFYKPQVSGIKALEKEMEDSLNCPDCLPLCSSTYFGSDFLKTNLNEESYYISNFADKNNLSVLHIYLASPVSLLYKTKVKLTWYDILSNFGGMLGLFMGFSLISLAEVVYFATLRLYQNLMEMHMTKKNVDINFYRQNIFKKQTYSDVEMKLMSAYDRKNRGYTFMN